MTDSTLTRDQGVALLRKLSTDDAFRELFESKPAKALHEAGIPSDTIVNLNAACLCPGKLASKEALAQVLGQLDEQTFASALKMIIPSINLSDR
ncbi:MAG: NHLP-related RiPP peptide [Xanthomonadales bacterium]|uniref:NHLP-related RiPP peptide n=1 Tax=Dokdonella sp. TaxID=2291710 RepID=UPI002B6E32B2|nr:NHLP-related RiPP peptide [Xanthomonadales bacterium]HQX34688.1 NHLP-related RiPP peptide [Dokdonella sp.]MBK7012911.1 NHLP-related RiPP peptide [Xanthomonadales bacterium]MBK7210227.1 NHLP-related RiPP peptide [Xanthomonadales bacterium]MBL0223679.1 NHLP-related RiPP peptide [Xanthomonadales bacterium]